MLQSTYWMLPPEELAAAASTTNSVVIVPGLDLVDPQLPPAELLVITSAALDRGPWASAHIAEGTALADELLRWVGKVRDNGGRVLYAVSTDFAPGVNNNSIVAAADQVIALEPGQSPLTAVAELTASAAGGRP